MRWFINEDLRGLPSIAFVKEFLVGFNLAKLDWVRIDLGRGKYKGVYGRCWFPNGTHNFRISCQVPGPFPTRIVQRCRPAYLDEAGKYTIPDGCYAGAHCLAVNGRKIIRWVQVRKDIHIADADEAVAWIVGHEGFHFLRKTGQVPGRNIESEADAYGNDLLSKWQRH